MKKNLLSLIALLLLLPFPANALCSTSGLLIQWFSIVLGLIFIIVFGILIFVRVHLNKKFRDSNDENTKQALLKKGKRNRIALVLFGIVFVVPVIAYSIGVKFFSAECEDRCEGFDNSLVKINTEKTEYCTSVGGTVETYKVLGICGGRQAEYCKPDDVGKPCTTSAQCDIACLSKKNTFNEQGLRVGKCNSYEGFCNLNNNVAYGYDILFEETQSPSLGAAGGCIMNPSKPNLYTTQKSSQ